MGTNLIWPLQLEKEENEKVREEIIDKFERRLKELEIRKKNLKDRKKEKGTD